MAHVKKPKKRVHSSLDSELNHDYFMVKCLIAIHDLYSECVCTIFAVNMNVCVFFCAKMLHSAHLVLLKSDHLAL